MRCRWPWAGVGLALAFLWASCCGAAESDLALEARSLRTAGGPPRAPTERSLLAAGGQPQRQPPLPPPPRPFGSDPLRDYGTLALTFLFGCAATASGVGGGAVFVPLFDAVLGLGVKRAAALSQVAISAGALAGVAVLLSRRHPARPGEPLIDLELATILTPAVLLGASLGVLSILLLPAWLLTALLLILLAAVALSTALKGRALHRLETEAKMKRWAAAAQKEAEEEVEAASPPPDHHPSTPPATLAGVPDASRSPPHRLDWGDRATSDAFEAALNALTPQSRRASRAPPEGAVDPAAAVAAAVATVAAAAAALEGGAGKDGKGAAAAAPAHPPGHPLLTRASAASFLILAALWTVLTGLQAWRARAAQCSPAWAGAIGAQVALAGLASIALVARAVHCARCKGTGGQGMATAATSSSGVCGRPPSLRTPGRLATASLASVAGGFIGGLLGLGGGILIAPLLLALRLEPAVAAATSTLLVLFSSSSAAVAAASTPGALSGLYVAAFAPVAALAGLAGVVTAARFVKASGRESLLVFLLAAVVAAGAVLTAAVSGPKSVAQVRGGQGGFKGVCG